MKKVLIITYYWPPSGGPGVQRVLKFAKYLKEFGWEPIIYAPENGQYPAIDPSLEKDIPAGITILKHPILEPFKFYKILTGKKQDSNNKANAVFISDKKELSLLQKLSIWIRGNFFIPDARKFWINPSVKYLSEYLSKNKVDVIFSSGPPYSIHLIAMRLREKLNIPWIADYRDPWTKSYFYSELMLTSWADKKHHRLEKETLSRADTVAVIGETMKQEFGEIVNRKIEIITNGYDEDDIYPSANIIMDKKFSLVYVGILLEDSKPFILWRAVSELIRENASFAADVELKFIGRVFAGARKCIEDYNLINYVTLVDYVPHEQVNKLQQQSQVLLMTVYNTPFAKSILTGKLFEYLIARRPILFIGPEDGDAAKVIYETKAGVVNNFDDVDALKKKILTYYDQYKAGTLKINSIGIEQYSRKNITGKLAVELNKLVNKPIV